MNSFAWLQFLCWCILLCGTISLVGSAVIHQVPVGDGTVGVIHREKRLFKSPRVNKEKQNCDQIEQELKLFYWLFHCAFINSFFCVVL